MKTPLLSETTQPILVSQSSLLSTQRRDCIIMVSYWLWRGGLASLAGRVDRTLSIYRTHSEGTPKRLLNIIFQGPNFQFSHSSCFYHPSYLFVDQSPPPLTSPLLPELSQKFKQFITVDGLIVSVKIKTPGAYKCGGFSARSRCRLKIEMFLLLHPSGSIVTQVSN